MPISTREIAKDIDFAIDVTEPREVLLARFTEIIEGATRDLQAERDLYRGTLVGLLPVCDADPSPLGRRIKRYVNQVLR